MKWVNEYGLYSNLVEVEFLLRFAVSTHVYWLLNYNETTSQCSSYIHVTKCSQNEAIGIWDEDEAESC